MGPLPLNRAAFGLAALVFGCLQTTAKAGEAMSIPKPPDGLGGTVTREPGKAVIQDVPFLAWGKSGDSTFAGALESALAVTKHPVSRRDIMAASGLAFRVRWFYWKDHPWWCPSTPVGEFPEEQEAVSRATGWQFRQTMLLGQSNPEGMKALAPDLVAYINAGLPVVGYSNDWNCGVCFGYEEEAQTFLWWDYFRGGEPMRLPAAKPGGPWLLFPAGYGQPPSPRENLLAALKLAVRHWRRDMGPNPDGAYWYGDAAYVQWRDDLGRAAEFPEKVQADLFFADWWVFETLADARMQAGPYLRDAAPLLEGPAREALTRAAALYEEEAGLLGRYYSHESELFPGPWTGMTIKDWTAVVRAREIEVLGKCRELERRAVEEMEKALALCGEKIP